MADIQEDERQSLIQKLHDSVKQCQVEFGDKKNTLATDSDSCVACVIVYFEQALWHGLKRNKVWGKITSLSEPFRQVTQKMLPEADITFWTLLKEYLGPLDVQHFNSLEHVTTDTGRARVWLRTALNESTLENHLNSILGHKTLRSNFYETWAVMMDDEEASTIPTMARGLASILFAIDTKSSHLNQPFKLTYSRTDTSSNFKTHRRIKSSPLPVMAETSDHEEPISKKLHTSRKNKKKRKVVEARINNMDESYASSSPQSSNFSNVKENSDSYYSSTPDLSSTNDDIYKENLESSTADTTAKYIETNQATNYQKLDSPFDNDITMDSVETSRIPFNIENECVTAQLESLNIFPKKTSSSESSSEQSNYVDSSSKGTPLHSYSSESSDISEHFIANNSPLSDTLNQNMKNTLTIEEKKMSTDDSIRNGGVNEQCSNEGTTYLQILSFDVESLQAVNDTIALVSASNSDSMFQIEEKEKKDNEKISSSDMEKYIPRTDSNTNNEESTSLSTDDLKKAIIATAKKKDEVEEKRRLLQCLCDDQLEEISSLRQEIDSMKKESIEKETQHEIHVEQLNQEIDFLKKQLKKYLSSIQVESPKSNDEHDTKDDPPIEKESSTELFEKRIQQMAEMHGELMEFQDNLQKQLIYKNHEISCLKEQLISLRGPLPDEDSVSLRSVESTYSPSKMLINIWIPSVFLKTKGTESFHLYQNSLDDSNRRLISIETPNRLVYVHVGNDEWNIYRRYSQFSKLHSEVVKSHPSLEKFNFPKKKIFGKKDEKLVEKRRHQFQEYLRTVINALIADKSISTPNACKRKLIELLPFFGDNYDEEVDKKKKKKGKNSSEPEPQYSGL